MDQLASSLNNVNFSHVHSALLSSTERNSALNDRERTQRAATAFSTILNLSKFQDMLPKQMLLVTSDDTLLSVGKDAGLMTVKYRAPQGLYGQVSTDFSATCAVEVQDALEALNGVAMRGSAFKHRSL